MISPSKCRDHVIMTSLFHNFKNRFYNGCWCFSKTNVDGKLYIFRNIFFVIFSWLSVNCCIDDFTVVYITNRLFWQSQIFLSYTRNINLVRTNPTKWSPSHKNKLRFNQDKPCKLINLSIKWGNYQESLKGSKCA